jgi:DNA-binding CsgD family transcriptional regulator
MTSSGRLALAASPLVTGALQALQRATGLPVTMGGPVSAGSRSLVIDQLRGTATRSLQHLRVDTGAGLGGKAVALRRPSTVIDYLSAQGITHKYDRAVAPEQLRAIVALPVRVGESTRAVLYAATRESITFGDRVLRAATAVVSRLERDIEVEEEVRRRIAAEAYIPAAEHRKRRFEALAGEQRELLTELLAIAGSMHDVEARARLLGICERLGPAAGGGFSGGLGDGGGIGGFSGSGSGSDWDSGVSVGTGTGLSSRSTAGGAIVGTGSTGSNSHRTGGGARVGGNSASPSRTSTSNTGINTRVRLSPRELDVLRLVSTGCTNDEISASLGLQPNTVKSYLKHAMRKLDAANRIQAVNRARAAGLLD